VWSIQGGSVLGVDQSYSVLVTLSSTKTHLCFEPLAGGCGPFSKDRLPAFA